MMTKVILLKKVLFQIYIKMEINKQIMESKNKGLFNKILEETKKYPFSLKVRVTYFNGLRFKAIIINENWEGVYNLE